MDELIYRFFFESLLTKEAGGDYYMQNRDRILQKQRAYRQAHAMELAKKRKSYYKKVKSGQHRQQKRIHAGVGSYQLVGYK